MTDRKDKILFHIYSSAMIIMAALLYSATVNYYHILIITLLALSIPLFTINRFVYTDRSIIYSIMLCLLTAFITDLVFPVDKNSYSVIGDIFSTSISAPMLIYLAAATTYFRYNEYAFGFSASFCLMSIMLASDVNVKDTAGLGSVLYLRLYLMSIALVMVFILLGLQMNKKIFHVSVITAVASRRRMKAFLIFCAVFIAVSSSAISLGMLRKYETSLRSMDIFLSKIALMHFYRHRFIVFGKEVNLNRTIDNDIRKNSSKVVIRAISESPPGYLRGRVYDKYLDGKWFDSDLTMTKLKQIKNEEILTFSTFTTEEQLDTSKKSTIVFLPEKNFLSDVMLVPGNIKAIDISANTIVCSSNGIFYPGEWDAKTGFNAYVDQIEQNSSFQGPAPPFKQNFLDVPKNIRPQIDILISDALKAKKLNLFRNDKELVIFLEGYFNEYFKYEIVPTLGSQAQDDPVISFLKRKSGHCELFATAMIMTLRRCGIPARYITGFICEENNPNGNYFIARLGNAHAWVEAYLRDENRWILSEPTPPSGISSYRHSMGFFEQASDFLKTIFLKMLDDIRKGFFARAIIEFFKSLFSFAKDILWHPRYFLPVGVGIFFLLALRRYRRVKRSENPFGIEGRRLIVSKRLKKVLNKICRNHGICRKSGQTLNDLLSSVKETVPAIFPALSETIELYNKIRFSQHEPSDEDVSKIMEMMKALSKNNGIKTEYLLFVAITIIFVIVVSFVIERR